MTMIPIKMTSDGGLSVINHAPTAVAPDNPQPLYI